MFKKLNNRKGFTLVELIVVIVILGVLAAIAVPSLIGYISKANVAADISEASGLSNAAMAYVTYVAANPTDALDVSKLTADDIKEALTSTENTYSAYTTKSWPTTRAFSGGDPMIVEYDSDEGRVYVYAGSQTTTGDDADGAIILPKDAATGVYRVD